ncbi:MAG: endonuclease III [Candidatus Omnitrophota bacterium]
MVVNNSNIHEVIRRISRAVENFETPSVTLVGKRWRNPFLILISCLLSLRTKDQTTLSASERLFKLADTPEDMLKLENSRIEQAIYPAGFYRTKAARIKEVCRDLVERFEGRVPDDLDQLLSMKGVGRKTANLVITEAFGKPGICVDTHVHRISNRFGYVKTSTPNETEQVLRKKLPKEYWLNYNLLLVMWGQNICKPVSPLCSQCAVLDFCAQAGVTQHR